MRTFCFICAFLLAGSLSAESNNPVRQTTNYLGTPTHSLLNINNWAGWIQFDGISGCNPILGGAGVWYPRGTATIIFQDGIIWGGYTNDGISPRLRVGGQTYLTGTQPGHIISPGVAQNPNDPDVRIYRVRPDYLTVSDEELKRDAAELNAIDTSAVTQAMINTVRNQYALDWSEWPGDEGAPFYDLNSNGSWDPGTDEPGLLNADQVLWFVCNDLNSSLTTALYGSPPIGLELQVTMWGYKGSGSLGQCALRRYRIINKSGYTIDSMFVAQWSDPDVGNPGNDFAGCDSIFSLGFAYNGYPVDEEYQQYGLAPAVIGYDLLQGPIVPSLGDTAIFDFKKVFDYKNLPLTSFWYHPTGSAFPEPPFRDYSGTKAWYNMLNGFLAFEDSLSQISFLHGSGPYVNQPTKFPLNGDPVTGMGDIDGQGLNIVAGERKFSLASGPFTMQDGDTQEMVIGIVGGISNDYLQSVNQMKDNDKVVQALYNVLFEFQPTPLDIDVKVRIVSSSQTDIHFKAVNTGADSIRILIKTYGGNQLVQLLLYDDGLHGDGAPGDGEFGNDWQTTPYGSGLYLDADVLYKNGYSYYWEKAFERLTTSGPVSIPQIIIGSDNLNHDGVANPGENIRYTVEVDNQTSFTFSNVRITQRAVVESQFVNNLSTPNSNKIIPQLMNNNSYSWPYSPSDNYYQFDISSNYPGNDSIHIVIELSDENYNVWLATTALWVESLSSLPQDYLMEHTSGNAYGRLGYRLFDPNHITGHSYRVSFNNTLPTGMPLYDLTDLTTGSLLFSNQPYPDEYGHNSQVVDGFFITRGTTTPFNFQDWDWQSLGPRWLTGVDFGGRLFFGGVDYGQNWFGSTINPEDAYTVKIIFDSTIVTNCAVYRRDLGYTYMGIGTFYGAAYDYSDPSNPRRINIVFTEDNNEKPADMIWNPDSSTLGGREYLFLMDSDYDPVTAGGYNDLNFGPTADVVWVAWTALKGNHTFLEYPADFFLIVQRKITIGNVYEFTPVWTGFPGEEKNVFTFQLMQNYPNPFNPVTHISFSLAQNVKVKLEIFNVLGQKIRTVINKKLLAGQHTVIWDGKNELGNQMASGIYFYRLQAGDFVKTRKLILMK
jgi:hypothetical protein